MKATGDRNHYSYTVYADPATARTFDERRFGGPIGELVAAEQGRVLTNFIGRVHGRRILDVGTGTGRAAVFLARGGAVVTGVDASNAMLDIARERAAGDGVTVRFLLGDAHALEFPDRTFDVTISLRLLMHAPGWRDCVAELCRVADRLVILDYPSATSFAAIESAARRLLSRLRVPTEPYRVLTDRAVRRALEQSGFRVRSVHRQFVLPIALHKAIGSVRFTRAAERGLSRIALRGLCGSPVTLVAERCASS